MAFMLTTLRRPGSSSRAGAAGERVRAAKQAAMLGLGQPLEHALAMNYTEVLRMRRSEDSVEGPGAFAEKRKPRRQGR
jgi:enoyl-CoA hydratase/carnithine racemase